MIGKTLIAALVAAVVSVSIPTMSAAEQIQRDLFFEETAEAFWTTSHLCAGGSTVQSTLLVRSTRDFTSPETEDPDPTARVQFLAVCPDGSSFSWAAPAAPATIQGNENLKYVLVSGAGTARDILGQTHEVTFEVAYVAVGPLETTVNGPGSIRKEREAVALGRVTFDGAVLVAGFNNHPTRPAPFIRQDLEF